MICRFKTCKHILQVSGGRTWEPARARAPTQFRRITLTFLHITVVLDKIYGSVQIKLSNLYLDPCMFLKRKEKTINSDKKYIKLEERGETPTDIEQIKTPDGSKPSGVLTCSNIANTEYLSHGKSLISIPKYYVS